jgi:hypothetical protein
MDRAYGLTAVESGVAIPRNGLRNNATSVAAPEHEQFSRNEGVMFAWPEAFADGMVLLSLCAVFAPLFLLAYDAYSL